MFFARSFTSGNTNANWMRDYNPAILRGGASLYTSFREENVYRFAIFELRPYAGPIAAICRALSRNNAGKVSVCNEHYLPSWCFGNILF
jgi:hypothetical protein